MLKGYEVKLLKASPWILRIMGLLVFFLIPVWSIWLAPILKKIPDNFSYSAEILSLDNFYNEKLKKFEGDHISKTIFSYKVVKKTPSYLVIQNSFTVRTLSDRPIFSASRLYYIDPYKGQHVVVAEKSRSGYLFAPRYVNKQEFDYWHINYDAPARMKYVNREKIDGLTVYHYKEHYQADQTINLEYLPKVPQKRGIKTDIILQLWIEPISGWLVKYQDNAVAYYYDRKTGKQLVPWNSFSNRYTQNSIRFQVQQATRLKWKILIVDFLIPILLGVVGFIFILISYINKNIYSISSDYLKDVFIKLKQNIFLCILIILLVVAAIESIYYIFLFKKHQAVYRIGVSQWNDNPEFVAAIQGFKAGLAEYGFYEGKNIKFFIKNPHSNIEKQINIIQSFVKHNVNLIYTLTTPGTLVAKGITTRIPIVFTDVTYPSESEIINPLQTKTNLTGVRNYISLAQLFYYFESIYKNTKVIAFVHQKGDSDSEIQLRDLKKMLNKRNLAVIDIAAIDFDDLKQKLQANLNQYNVLFVACDSLIRMGGGKIVAEFSKQYKIPSFSCDKESVVNGVLVGYFADLYDMGKLAGKKAALILRGAEAGWLHTETPEQAYLIVNITTARLLGINVPDEILQQTNMIVNK